MKNIYKSAAATLILVIISSVIFAEENNFFSDVVKKDPLYSLMGSYLVMKDFVHRQLGAQLPYVYMKDKITGEALLFPRIQDYTKDKRLVGRYRNVGYFMLFFPVLNTFLDRVIMLQQHMNQ